MRGIISDTCNEPRDYKLQLWDTAGQERFRSLCGTYIQQSSVLWVCIDGGNMASFRAVRDYWWPRVMRETSRETSSVVLLTKMDAACAAVCGAVRAWALDANVTVLETSAKTGAGVDAVGRWTVDACHRAACWREPITPSSPAAPPPRCCGLG